MQLQCLVIMLLIIIVELFHYLDMLICLLVETLLQHLQIILLIMVELLTLYYCSISYEGSSTTMFNNNIADISGGAVFSYYNSSITFEGISTTLFSNNTADYGGGILSGDIIYFNGNSNTVFRDNTANNNGGAMLFITNLTFDDYSTVIFINNKATIGATIFSFGKSNKIIEVGNPTLIFNDYILIHVYHIHTLTIKSMEMLPLQLIAMAQLDAVVNRMHL